jgi:hypothetical protein
VPGLTPAARRPPRIPHQLGSGLIEVFMESPEALRDEPVPAPPAGDAAAALAPAPSVGGRTKMVVKNDDEVWVLSWQLQDANVRAGGTINSLRMSKARGGGGRPRGGVGEGVCTLLLTRRLRQGRTPRAVSSPRALLARPRTPPKPTPAGLHEPARAA